MTSLCVSVHCWRSLWYITIFLSFMLAAIAATADYVYLQLLEPHNSTFFYTKLVPTVPPSACSPIENSLEVSNNIAFAIRGGCSFVTKAVYAQAAGAVAFIAYDYDETSRQITIPCAFMRGRFALEILTRLEAFGLKYAVVNFPVNSVGASIAVAHHRPWTLCGITLQLSAQTARARSRNDGCFRQLQKMTAKSARDDRKQYWAEIATSMEQASNVGDTLKLYQLIRQVSGKPSTLSDSVRDVDGGFIADNSAKVERWREVADAIRKLRNNKAPGEDGIAAEIFKSCVGTLAPWVHEKGDKTRCENYCGISLIDVAAKIFAIVLLRRFQAVRDSRTGPNQAGFRAGRGCADQICTLIRILEFCHSYQQPTAVCFIDLVAAFDSVQRESLWRIMALGGVPAKIIAMIKAYYCSTTERVLILGRALRESHGVEFAPGHRLTDLDYADDIALLASSFGDLQSMMSRVNEVAKSVGLPINTGKTKVFSSCIPDQAPLGIDGRQLEEVDSFKYLGARPLPNEQSKDDIVSRIDAARWVFSSLRKCLWIRGDLSIATKIRVYCASVRSVLLYGCECWALCVEDERKLEVFAHH
ncbi:hypothetical protein SprV_0100149400 [Sparganum proliferum]